MSEVIVVEAPELPDRRSAFVLREDRIGHYPEFREFFARTFDLERVGLTRKGYLQAPSGMVYAVVFIGRSGEVFPSGLELFALPAALEPLDAAAVDGRGQQIAGHPVVAGVLDQLLAQPG